MKDRVYEQLKEIPGFDLLSLDQQGEMAVTVAKIFSEEDASEEVVKSVLNKLREVKEKEK